jgi:hypothetical protein
MMRKALAVLVACGVLVVGVTAAAAHDWIYSSTIQMTSWGTTPPPGFTLHATGYLTAHNGKCVPGRTVRLYFVTGATKTPIDVDSSSLHGAWSVKGDADSKPDSFVIRLARKRIDLNLGPSHHHVCAGDTVTTPIP